MDATNKLLEESNYQITDKKENYWKRFLVTILKQAHIDIEDFELP